MVSQLTNWWIKFPAPEHERVASSPRLGCLQHVRSTGWEDVARMELARENYNRSRPSAFRQFNGKDGRPVPFVLAEAIVERPAQTVAGPLVYTKLALPGPHWSNSTSTRRTHLAKFPQPECGR